MWDHSKDLVCILKHSNKSCRIKRHLQQRSVNSGTDNLDSPPDWDNFSGHIPSIPCYNARLIWTIA